MIYKKLFNSTAVKRGHAVTSTGGVPMYSPLTHWISNMIYKFVSQKNSTDLIINGIPVSVSNLNSAYKDICKAIGLDVSAENINYSVYRLKSFVSFCDAENSQ